MDYQFQTDDTLEREEDFIEYHIEFAISSVRARVVNIPRGRVVDLSECANLRTFKIPLSFFLSNIRSIAFCFIG